MSAIDFPDELLELERSAWEAIQAGTLTVDQALAVHTGVVAFAKQAGLPRIDVEMGLKQTVRHPEGPED